MVFIRFLNLALFYTTFAVECFTAVYLEFPLTGLTKAYLITSIDLPFGLPSSPLYSPKRETQGSSFLSERGAVTVVLCLVLTFFIIFLSLITDVLDIVERHFDN